MEYLHNYSNERDFRSDYNGNGEVTAITIHSAELFQTCNNWDNMVETHDYDGTYVFDREEEITNATDCEGNPVDWFTRVKVFKNGNKEIYAPYSNDIEKWSYEDGFIEIIQDFSSIYQAGDGELYNFTLERAEGPYHEPWVSLTAVNRIARGSKWYDHVGEDDVYDSKTGDYIGKMHLWESENGRDLIISESETPGTNDTIYIPYRDEDLKYRIDTASTATPSWVQRGPRVDYNKNIWMDLSSYEYPVNGSLANLGTVPEPKPSNHGKVYVKEPDGQTRPYNYEKEEDGAVRLWRQYPDGSGYTIEISPDGTAQWYYNERKI